MDLDVFLRMLLTALRAAPADKDRMFPRRRTDQVYSTLQQVQRRITEQSGASAQPGGPIKALPPNAIPHNRPPVTFTLPSSVPAPSALPVPQEAPAPAPSADPDPPGDAPSPAAGQAASPLRSGPTPPPPPAAQTLYPPASGSRRYIIQVSSEMAMLLVVVGLMAMGLCYFLGRYYGGAGAGAGLASGVAGSREPAAEAPIEPVERLVPSVPSAPHYILVLQSEPVSPDVRARYRQGVKALNDWAVGRGAVTGAKPLFGLREPANGNIELIYGLGNGRTGLTEQDARLQAILAKQYGGATWMMVR